MPAAGPEITTNRQPSRGTLDNSDPDRIGVTAVEDRLMDQARAERGGSIPVKSASEKSPAPSRKRSTFINLMGSQGIALATIVRNILLVPIYLHTIGAELYGLWIATAGAAAFMQLADMGLPRMLIQRSAELDGAADRVGLGRTIASGLLALAIVTLAIVAVLLPLADWLPNVLGLGGERARILTLAFRLALVDGGLTLIVYGEGGILLGLQRPGVPTASLILGQFIGIAATLVFLRQGQGLIALPLGMLVGTVVAWVITSIALVRVLRDRLPGGSLRFHSETFRRLLASSIRLAVSRVSRVIAFQSPALIAAKLMSPLSVVVMDLTRKSSLLVSDVVGRLMMSLHPGLAHLVGAGEDQKYRQICRLLLRSGFMLAMLGIGGVVALNRTFVRLWTGDIYYGGDLLTSLFCAHLLLQILGVAAYFILISRGMERVIIRASLLESALQVGLSIVMGMAWGLVGIAGAAVIAAGVGLILQAGGVDRSCGLKEGCRQGFIKMSRCVGAGCLPVILGVLLRSTLEPRDWFQAAFVAMGYLLIGSVAMAVADRQVFELLSSCFRTLRKRPVLD
jgi:O-antigen/teichoic acid export membrane protein